MSEQPPVTPTPPAVVLELPPSVDAIDALRGYLERATVHAAEAMRMRRVLRRSPGRMVIAQRFDRLAGELDAYLDAIEVLAGAVMNKTDAELLESFGGADPRRDELTPAQLRLVARSEWLDGVAGEVVAALRTTTSIESTDDEAILEAQARIAAIDAERDHTINEATRAEAISAMALERAKRNEASHE